LGNRNEINGLIAGQSGRHQSFRLPSGILAEQSHRVSAYVAGRALGETKPP